MYKKILVPLDGSPLARTALSHARDIALHTRAEITLLHVVVYSLRDFLVTDPLLSASLADDILTIRHKAADDLEQTAASLRRAGLCVKTAVCDGKDVAETILEYASEMRADLIVMTTHGRSGVARWLLGSVAKKIVQGTSTAMLVIRPSKIPSEVSDEQLVSTRSR
jgi:nucleotide-binding universal stress UspA family protein